MTKIMTSKLGATFSALMVLSFTATSFAAYSNPPSWMPMTMIGISYNASTKTVSVQPQSIYSYGSYAYPTLNAASGAYNAAANTYDPSYQSYDPAAVWSVLNGTAFSRRLGWYDYGYDDFYGSRPDAVNISPLPAGAYIWIEKTGGSPELKTYFVSETDNPNGPYTPIFGTDGSSTRWLWDGFMDHNANAVDLADITQANQLFYADYTIYVGDVNGHPLDGYTAATTTWTWLWAGAAPTLVPEPASLMLMLVGGAMLIRKQK